MPNIWIPFAAEGCTKLLFFEGANMQAVADNINKSSAVTNYFSRYYFQTMTLAPKPIARYYPSCVGSEMLQYFMDTVQRQLKDAKPDNYYACYDIGKSF